MWTTKVMLRAGSVVRTSEGLYNVRIVPNSLSRHGYTETKLCGMYRNELDKCGMLLSAIKDNEVADKVRTTAWEMIQKALLSFADLRKFDVGKKIVELVLDNKTFFDGIDSGNMPITDRLLESNGTDSASRYLKRQRLFYGAIDQRKGVLLNWLISIKRKK